ncbi:MAG TPA: L-histidine N(alpha)-methyltransferase [Candidatus Saccharimonadales bacterium]|nr:L-histidine N(alpha)-methyltransferase [Candidatus Saccharimonadales bacterium]
MKYFKNTELAKLYNVSEKSVRNWIDATKQGKLELELYTENGRQYIANSSKNTAFVESLVQKGKKYKNSRGAKLVRPVEKFYSLYTQKQIVDIISNIDIYREIPLQYCYFNSGADHWDQYTRNLVKDNHPNPLNSTVQLLDLNLPYLDLLLEDYSAVNIIDIGVGNALPVRSVLTHFVNTGKLNRYIGLDISTEMLTIAERNIQKWFDGKVEFEGHVRDFNQDRFGDLLVADTFNDDDTPVANLIFFLGGTINNLREPNHALAAIHDSMGKDDLFLFSKKLDTEKSRLHFDVTAPGNLATTLVVDLLNIDRDYYDIEQYFNEQKMAREARIKLKVAITIEFELEGKHRFVEINKGESILLWRALHQSALETIDQFSNNGFELVQAAKSKDNNYLMMMSRIKTGQ